MSKTCTTCNIGISTKFCPECGHPQNLKKIDGRYIFNEIKTVLNFEKGFLYTIRELIYNPGKSINEFINENRNKLVKPIVFLIISSLIYTILNSIIHFEEGYINYSEISESTVSVIFQWIQNNYGYANIFMAIFIAWWLKIFFRKQPYNIYEVITMLFFVMGIGMLIYSIFGVIEGLAGYKMIVFGGIIGFIYSTWAIGQFFGRNKATSYLKAFLAYILGSLSFYLIAFIFGLTIDFF
jgi:hypothetical protein